MTAATRPRAADRRDTWAEANVGIGCVMFDTTPEAAYERLPLAAGPFVLAADARIDNRAELERVLGGDLRELGLLSSDRPVTDADLILAAFARWGRASPERIVGDFAFAVLDRRRRSLFLARDPMGVRPLYLYDGSERVAVATEPAGLFAGGVRRDLDLSFFHHLLETGDTTTADRTPYAGVRLIPNGHALEIRRDGTDEWRYHELKPSGPPPSDDDAVHEFDSLFRSAVAARTRLGAGVGVQLSGGLDSSYVACVARDLLGKRGVGPVKALTLLFDETPETDEREFAEIVLATGGFEPIAVPADGLSPLGNLDAFYQHLDDGPATGTQHLVWAMYEAAGQAGLRVLLDGVDGDTTVEHGELRLQEMARAGDWAGFFREASLLGDTFGADPRAEWVRSVETDFAAGPRLLFSVYGLAALDETAAMATPWTFARSLAGAIEYGQARPTAIIRRLWRRLLAPRAVLRRTHPEYLIPAPSVRSQQLEKLLDPGLSRSMALMTHAGAAFGLEIAHPFHDVRLLEFCLSLPSSASLRNGTTRWILREAMSGVVPDAIVNRAVKNTMTPAFHRALFEIDRHRLDAAVSSLRAWPGPTVPMIADIENAASRLAEQYDKGLDVAGPDGALLAARASIALWADKLGLV